MSENNIGRPQGGTMLDKVKADNNAPARINSEFQMPKIRLKDTDTPQQYRCTCCGKVYTKQEGNFLKAGDSILWQANKGYMPICRTCADTIFNSLTEFYSGNEEKSLKLFCGYMDMFYDEEASAMAAKHLQAGRTRLSAYPSKMNTRQIKMRGSTYLDTIKVEQGESGTIKSFNDIVTPTDDNVDYVVTEEITKRWGYGLKPEEYQWLDEQEQDWRNRTECKTKAQEELIRTICIAQLNMRKAQQSGGNKILETMKTFQDLLASCNLQPRQNTDTDFADQNTFGTLIKKLEQEEPVPDPDPEWEDVDEIKRYLDTWFLGHLCNLTHVNNDYEAQYREELDKYTVKPPVYESDGEAVDVSILDKYSNKGDKKDE